MNSVKELFQKFIGEELTPSQKAKVDTWEKGDNSFSDHAYGGDSNEHRVTHELESPDRPTSEHFPKIEQHLSQHGYKVKDYTAGKATDKYGREISIGKVLNKTGADPALKKGFEEDPARGQATKATSNLQMTVSRHPYDVAGMTSKGHSWEEESCMNFKSGSNRQYLPEDVKNGTHVAYLHHKDDPKMKKPLARIAMKKYTNIDDPNDSILRPENKTYGAAPDAFSHTVNRWVNRHFPGRPDAIYKKNPHVYDDTPRSKYVIGEKALDKAVNHPDEEVRKAVAGNASLKPHHLDTLMLDSSDRVARIALDNPNVNSDHVETGFRRGITSAIAHPKASSKLVNEVLTRKDKNGDYVHDDWSRRDAASNPNATKAHLDAAVSDPSEMVRSYAAENPNLNSTHLHKLLRDSDMSVSARAARHENLTGAHISQAIDHHFDRGSDSKYTMVNLGYNRNIKPKHIDRMLDHPDADIRRAALRNKKASAANITKAMNDPKMEVRRDAMEHDNANSAHIRRGMADESEHVRLAALKNKNFGPEHVRIGLHPSQPLTVRTRAAKHPSATPSQISGALKDRHIGVRMAAMENPSATSDHIHTAIRDGDDPVRQAALYNPNATREHIEAAAKGHPDLFSTEIAQTMLKTLNKKRK